MIHAGANTTSRMTCVLVAADNVKTHPSDHPLLLDIVLAIDLIHKSHNVPISVWSGVLWGMGQEHCGICQIGLLLRTKASHRALSASC